MKWIVLLTTLLLAACNSQQSKLSSIGGIGGSSFPTDPYITSVTVPATGIYTTGQTLNFSFKFSKVVEVQGTPRLTFAGENAVRHADYVSGSGSDTLQFSYTIADGISDDNGISLSLALDLNGGSIFDSISDEDARLTYTSPATWGIIINASTASIVSISPPANGTYSPGQTLRFIVNFSERVCGTNTPRLPLSINGNMRYATRVVEGCATSMKFDYVIQAGESDNNGIELANVSIDLSVGPAAIKDSFNEPAILTYTATSYPLVQIANVAIPPVEQPRTVPADGTLKIGDHLEVILNFNEAVFVTGGTPHITATIGGSSRNLVYLGGSGTAALVFRYTIVEGDLDTDGIAIGAISYNGSSIKDAENNAAPMTQSWPSLAGVKVDGVRPVIASISSPIPAIYRPGASLSFVVTWSEHVNFTAPFPYINIEMDSSSTPKQASSSANDGYTTTYRYNVQNADADFNGISLPSASLILPGGGLITDDAGNTIANAGLSFGAQSTSDIKVVPSGVDHWYDPTNIGTYGTSSGSTLTQFKDLIGTMNGIVGAGIGWVNSPRRVDLASNDIHYPIPFASFQYFALVMTIKAQNPGQIIFDGIGTSVFLEISNGYSVGNFCGSCAQYWNGTSWVNTSAVTGDFGGANPSAGQKKIIILKFPAQSNVDLYLNAFGGWYLNELILLNGASVDMGEFYRALLMKHSTAGTP